MFTVHVKYKVYKRQCTVNNLQCKIQVTVYSFYCTAFKQLSGDNKRWLQFKILVVFTTKTRGGGVRSTSQLVCDFATGVWPTTNYFVNFLPGSGQLLCNFVIFYHQKKVNDSFCQKFLVFFCFFKFIVIFLNYLVVEIVEKWQ